MTKAEVTAICARAKELIRQGWVQRTFAKDADYRDVMPEDPAAVRWCLLGAINRSTFELDILPGLVLDSLYRMVDLTWPGSAFGAGYWNDQPGRTKEEVLDFIDSIERDALERCTG